MTHVFDFVAGIIVSFIMVLVGIINNRLSVEEKKFFS